MPVLASQTQIFVSNAAQYPSGLNAAWGQWVVTSATTSCANTWNTWSTTSTTTSIDYYAGQAAGLGQQALSQQQAAQQMLGQQGGMPMSGGGSRNAEIEKARDRAKTLMRDNLTPVQREALDKHGWFLVEGGKSGKLYRVRADSYAGNIYELDDKRREVARYCVHAHPEIPFYDHLLAQALSLRYDEDHIIGRANCTPLRVAA